MTSDERLEKAARLSAEHLSYLVQLTQAFLLRKDGLSTDEKMLIITTADLEHIKALHKVLQAKYEEAKKTPFSKFLRSLAEAEEREEANQKGGELKSLEA